MIDCFKCKINFKLFCYIATLKEIDVKFFFFYLLDDVSMFIRVETNTKLKNKASHYYNILLYLYKYQQYIKWDLLAQRRKKIKSLRKKKR